MVLPGVAFKLYLAATAVLLWLVAMTSGAVRYCRQDGDCDEATGQSCRWLYEGCPIGQCVCNAVSQFTDANGRCTAYIDGGDSCSNSGDSCRTGMVCRGGRCSCTSGHLTQDRQHCLQDNERLLGDSCNIYARHTTCLHIGADGYTPNDVICSGRGVCECAPGFKSGHLTCRPWNIGESGCLRHHQCSGGAICVDGKCRCPSGYSSSAIPSKCVRKGAEVDLPIGADCDEIDGKRYCSQGLVCHRCTEQMRYRCVRFLFADDYARLIGGESSSVHTTTTWLQLIGCFIYTLVLR